MKTPMRHAEKLIPAYQQLMDCQEKVQIVQNECHAVDLRDFDKMIVDAGIVELRQVARTLAEQCPPDVFRTVVAELAAATGADSEA